MRSPRTHRDRVSSPQEQVADRRVGLDDELLVVHQRHVVVVLPDAVVAARLSEELAEHQVHNLRLQNRRTKSTY